MLAGTDRLKLPLTSVMEPAVEPLAVTDAPINGEPSFESVTLPVIVLFCAIAGSTKKHNKARQLTFSKFLNCIKLGLKVY